MMRNVLILLFGAILLAMLVGTVRASIDRGITEVGSELLADRWFQVTLLDAYCGFITFFVWVAYKETALWSRLLWFVLIMGLGNIAMAVYMLLQLFRIPSDSPLSALLLRSDSELGS